MPAPAESFRVGVNYWPVESAMAWLTRYDSAIVRRDFARIAAAGMDTVRVFLRWDDLQPQPTMVCPSALASVVDIADAASACGVDLIVTLFMGHMSGVNWLPEWSVGGSDGDERFRVVAGAEVRPHRRILRNWYDDPEVLEAQVFQAEAVASALQGHPALWAWDLGNENSNCTTPPSASSADQWLERITSALRSRDADVLITVGTHMEDLEEDRVIGPDRAAQWCDFVCMHGYPAYAGWADGPADPWLVPFLAEITRWLAGGAAVLFAEFGQSTPSVGEEPSHLQVSEAAAAVYTARTLDALRDCGTIGALLWCYGDYAVELHDSPPLDLAPHERSFGLWRSDGSPKPAVAEIGDRRGRARRPPPPTQGWLDLEVDEFRSDRKAHLRRLYLAYRKAMGEGR